MADDGDALARGTGSSLAPRFSLVSEGLLKEQLHAVSWIPALGSGIPRAQIIAGFPVDFETGSINASHPAVVLFSCFGKANARPLRTSILLCEGVAQPSRGVNAKLMACHSSGNMGSILYMEHHL